MHDQADQQTLHYHKMITEKLCSCQIQRSFITELSYKFCEVLLIIIISKLTSDRGLRKQKRAMFAMLLCTE